MGIGPGYSNNTGTGMGYGRFGAIPLLGAQNGGGFFGGGKHNYDNNSTLPQHQQPVQGAGYGNDPYATAPAGSFSNTGPPPYGKDGASYAASPGPPPPAHITVSLLLLAW